MASRICLKDKASTVRYRLLPSTMKIRKYYGSYICDRYQQADSDEVPTLEEQALNLGSGSMAAINGEDSAETVIGDPKQITDQQLNERVMGFHRQATAIAVGQGVPTAFVSRMSSAQMTGNRIYYSTTARGMGKIAATNAAYNFSIAIRSTDGRQCLHRSHAMQRRRYHGNGTDGEPGGRSSVFTYRVVWYRQHIWPNRRQSAGRQQSAQLSSEQPA